MASIQEQILQALSGVPSIVAGAVIFAVVLVTAGVLAYVVLPALERAVTFTESEYDDIVLQGIRQPVFITVVGFGTYFATLPIEFAGNIREPLFAIIVTAVVFTWMWNSVSISRDITDYIRDSQEDEIGFIPILQNIINIIVVGLGVLIVMSAWNVNVAPFLASAGIVGIVIGFAAKDTVANFFGGVALYFDNTYRVGDFITLDDGTEGTVERITIRSTIIRTRDDVYVTVPNAVLNSSRVENQSAPNNMRRLVLPIGFEYGSDEDVIHDVLLDAAERNDDVLSSPEPRPRLREFGDNGVLYELLVWIPDPEPAPRIRHEVNEEIYRQCEDNDLVIPFPQRRIHFESAPEEKPPEAPRQSDE